MSLRPLYSIAIALMTSAVAASASSASAAGLDLTWKGPATDARWSVDANWVGGTAPSPNSTVDSLSFVPETSPSCDMPACVLVENDVSGLSVGALSITDPRLKIAGKALTLGAGGLQVKYSALPLQAIVATPITLGTNQTWTIQRATNAWSPNNEAHLHVGGPLTGSHELTVEFDTSTTISLSGGTEVGPVMFKAPPTQIGSGHDRIIPVHAWVLGDLNAASGNPITVHHGTLDASGGNSFGPLELRDGGLRLRNYKWPTSQPNIYTAAGLTMDADSQFGVAISGAGTTRGVDYSSLSATGAVRVAGHVDVMAGSFDTCFEPKVGDRYTIISTTGTLSGKFSGDVSENRESIYPGYRCPDASDRALEYRYDRTSMPRTVEMVVVRRTDPAVIGQEPASPSAPQSPTSPAPAAPDVTLGTASNPNPGPGSGPGPNPGKATTAPAAPVPGSGLFLQASKLRMTDVAIKLRKRGSCPEMASVTITGGKRKMTKRVRVRRSDSSCVIRSTVTLTGKLAKASRVKVRVSGKGIKTTTKTVQAAASGS